ncbi:MAG TPA: phytanoyl-CoA dioxygenase family protein [Rhizomicrobium sp.]|nr:phytanoyl-CoA dioxygenase family protein [Rhizomicrobium sp.]
MRTAVKIHHDESPAEAWTHILQEQGWCIIPNLIAIETVQALHADLDERFEKTPFCDGDFYGPRTKRFGSLLKRSVHAEAFARHPVILDIADRILLPHCDNYQINLTQALALYPGAPMQAPHRDQDMWRGPTGEIEYLINVMWPFTDYRSDNGATLLWSGSHRREGEDIIDLSEASAAEMDPGSALVFLGSTLHGAGANRADRVRRGMVISYCLGWLKPYENQWLAYPPAVARTFSPELAALAGYRQHRPNLGNYEGRCPSILLQQEISEYLGAADEMRPDQAADIALFAAEQTSSALIANQGKTWISRD